MPVTNYPVGPNTYVPSMSESKEATGAMQIEFSRNPNDFSFNRYIRVRPVNAISGLYLYIPPGAAARVLNADNSDFRWPRGQVAPTGNWNTQGFQFLPYITERFAPTFQIDHDAVDQASWDVIAVNSRMAAQQAMTGRTVRGTTCLTNATLWGGNTGTAASLTTDGSGVLSASTTTTLRVKSLFQNVAKAILKATIGVVRPKDIIAVMNPNTATLIANSPELVQHFIQSQFAEGQVRGDYPGAEQGELFGLPPKLYGIKTVIEDAVRVSSDVNAATQVGDFILGDGVIIFVSRPGGLTSAAGGPDFSTIQCFCKEDMTVWTKYDDDNRLHAGRVVDDTDFRLVAPVSGYYVTTIT